MCQSRFLEAGSCFHVCSQENHPVLFHNDEEFKAAMNTVAFAAFLFPDVRIFTFEIMDNHFHFAMAGEKSEIKLLLRTLVNKLASQPSLAAASGDIRKLDFKFFDIGSLDNMRNVISYINRNGAVVNPDENVFTYRWGANRFFFNREAQLRHAECGRKASCREKRSMFHSARFDSADVLLVGGYVSPLCYCRIVEGESFFRNGRHYFYSVSRNIESSKDIAKSVGECMFYTDEDLFSHIGAACSRRYGGSNVRVLPSEAKIELAKELHFDYNASNKQICRLLKMDMTTLDILFPGF